MLGPDSASKDFMEEILGIVEIHLDFFEDDLALFFDVVGVKFGTQDEIGDDVEGDGQVLVEDFGVEANLFFGSEGVEHAADGVHFAGDGFGTAALGSFENHVLDKVGEAVFGRRFATGAIAHPDTDRDGADVAHGLGQDDQTVGEFVALDVARFDGERRHECIVTQGARKQPTKGQQSKFFVGSNG